MDASVATTSTSTTQSWLKKAFTYYLIFQLVIWVVGTVIATTILVMRHVEAAKNSSAAAAVATTPVMTVNGVQVYACLLKSFFNFWFFY